MKIVGAATPNQVAQTLLDITESYDGYINTALVTTTQTCDSRGRITPGAGTAPVPCIFSSVVGAGLSLVMDAVIGNILVQYVSAAGSRQIRYGNQASGVKVPATVKFSDPASIPIPLIRPLRRYTLLVPVRKTVVGTAVVEVGLSSTNQGLQAGAEVAYAWSSDPAVNGGAWLPRFRQVAVGGITNGPSSGVVQGAAWHQLGMRYTEGAVPKIEWLLDGVPRHFVEGDANMPTILGTTQPFAPFVGVATLVAGTTLQQAAARFIVEEMAS